jgi:hypothetical protein
LDRLKRTLLIIVVLCSKQLSFTQNNTIRNTDNTLLNSNPERLFLHCNAATFVTGEKLYYKLYSLNPIKTTAMTVSKIAYIELVGEDNKIIFLQKLFLENGLGQGDFFVPSTLKSGNYKLVAYTNWMLNKSESEIFQINIFIINPYQTADNTVVITDKATPVLVSGSAISANNHTTENPVEKDNFTFELNQKTVATREKLVLKIKPLSQMIEKGNYSLSIRKIDSLPCQKQITAKEYKNTWVNNSQNTTYPTKKLILPELRGEMIAGSIAAKNGTDNIQNKTVALSIPGKNFDLKITTTNAIGKFIFNLEKANYSPNLVVQVVGEDRNNYSIQLDELKGIKYPSNVANPPLELTPNLKNSILQRSIATQIQNGYYSKKTDSIVDTITNDTFFKSTAKEYVLDDYKRFPSLQETITEVVFEMYYRKNGENFTIGLRDYNTTVQVPGNPLVLVDGLFIQNFNELFEFSTNNISKISIVPGGYFYGSQLFNGVISFTTKNQDFISKQSGTYILNTTILRPSVKKEYYTPDYTDKSKLERIPDYRYQLLWIPQLTLNSIENPISFYTSDVTGTFEITLEGFTDKGIPVSLKDTFEVQ